MQHPACEWGSVLDRLYSFRGPYFTESDLQAYRRRVQREALYVASTAFERLRVKRNTDTDIAGRTNQPVASEAHSVPVEDDAVLLGGISITLDVALWRSRFFWRLLAKAVVRRLGRK